MRQAEQCQIYRYESEGEEARNKLQTTTNLYFTDFLLSRVQRALAGASDFLEILAMDFLVIRRMLTTLFLPISTALGLETVENMAFIRGPFYFF